MIAGSVSAQVYPTNLKSVTYDTLLVGTANDEYFINFPQFDSSKGKLVSVKLNNTISLNYGYRLQNVETVQRDFTVQVERYDYITSLSLIDSTTIDTSVGNFLLNPNDVVSKNIYTILNRYSEDDSITDVASFIGNNNVAFDYITATYTNLIGSNQYAFSAVANDTVRFSMTYYYEIDNNIGTFIYPNPAINYINIPLPKNDWKIKIYSALGIFLQQYYFTNTSLVHIDFGSKLAAGMYFVKVEGKPNNNKVLILIVK